MCNQNPDHPPLPTLNEPHVRPTPREARAIARSRKQGERITSRLPRSWKEFREQYVRIQGPRLA